MKPRLKVYWVLTCLLLPLACYGSTELSLNGIWRFSADKYTDTQTLLGADYSRWDNITVPGNWDATEEYSDHSGKGYYQRDFIVPETFSGKHIRLKFDAVYHHVKVWLNGNLLGEHVGGYTPFEFVITDLVEIDQPNSLVVMADNSYQRGAWWAWGGISRDVSLIADEDLRILYQHISAMPDFENKKVYLSIKYKLQSQSLETINADLETVILDERKQLNKVASKIKIGPQKTKVHEVKLVEELSGYHLWDIHSPVLYTLSSNLAQGSNVIDYAEDAFGIRKFEVRGEQFFLNNRPVRLNGVNRIHDHPDYGNTEPDALVLRDMEDIKSIGANFARLMHAPNSENLLDICDRLGFLIIGEIPVWGDNDPQSFPGNPVTKQWLKEMIERDFNHPCVVGWSVGNELRDPVVPWAEKTLTPEQYGYVNSMLDYVEKLDPDRLKTYVSITAYNKPASLDNEPFEKLDFMSINSYGDAVERAMNAHKQFSGKPIFVSEIGLKQIGGSRDSRLDDKLVGYMKKLRDFPFVTGFSIWSYNDYRSNYKGTPESGFREWGIVDEQRNKKEAYYQLKEVFEYWNMSD